ncbi:hypothetical protein ABZS71_05075 [Streptomyces sp. NPDC005393]|uniref:hypothetical protein n=1 Tax=Streptomyces sp. NPDC005393 TaxID=3157041 RepID=UPI0033A0FE90
MMERVAAEVETELLDLSGATLEELDGNQEFALAIQRLLNLVQSPPTRATSADTKSGC